MLEQIGETDILWVNGYKPQNHLGRKGKNIPTHLILFNAADKGYATFAAGMALIEKSELIAKIYSKLLTVGGNNTIPEPVYPEMRLYETTNKEGFRFFILKINDCNSGEAHESQFAWLYTYPTYRDIVLSLNQCDIVSSTFFTVPCEAEDIVQLNYKPSKLNTLLVYDYTQKENDPRTITGKIYEDDINLSPSAWIWGEVFSSFNYPISVTQEKMDCSIVILSESEKFIDRIGTDDMLTYCSSVLLLDWDEQAIYETLENLNALDTIRNNIKQPTLDRFMNFDEDDFI